MSDFYRFWVEPSGCRFGEGIEHSDQGGFHRERWITINGVVGKDGRLGAILVLDDERSIARLPVSISVSIGTPGVHGDLLARQTGALAEWVDASTVTQACIGFLHYSAEFSDSETREHFPESLHASVLFENEVFDSLWRCASTPGLPLKGAYVDVFSVGLRSIENNYRNVYHWPGKRPEHRYPLYISGFG